ncbi:GNAT family N-acetyltransferase [Streptomyces sp. NPDC057552]|uniref:GNAT family N-acetyltransferase n=1 Tax=Streptomyces sp. NPDC057552 TaxID=3350537 RepID=UPI0036B66C54
MTVEIERWNTPEEARSAGWDTLLGPEDFFLTPPWMRVLHDSAGAWMRYFTAHDGERPLAAVPVVLATDRSPWALGRTDLLLRHAAGESMDGAAGLTEELGGDAALDALMPSMMAGGRHLGRTRLLTGPGAGPGTVHALLARVEEQAVAEGCRSAALPYVDASDTLVRGVLEERGYRRCVSGEFATLTHPGKGFTEYAMSLPSRRSRRVRSERRHIEASPVEIDLAPLRREDVPRLAALETELFGKYGMTGWDPKRSEAVLDAAFHHLGEKALVSRAVLDGRIIGFGLVLSHGSDWFAHRAGFDYEAQGKLPLYYELLYYTLADEAPAHGVSRVHYGIGSTEAKVSRGCVLSRQYLYVKEL